MTGKTELRTGVIVWLVWWTYDCYSERMTGIVNVWLVLWTYDRYGERMTGVTELNYDERMISVTELLVW